MEKQSKQSLKKKILLNIDLDLNERLDLANEVMGGKDFRGGKRSAIIRQALDKFLPGIDELQGMVDGSCDDDSFVKEAGGSSIIDQSFTEVKNP